MTALESAPAHWTRTTIGEVADVRLGRQRSPKNHSGTHMRRYLRAANVGWYRLRLDDVQEMNFTDDEMDTYRVEDGDILVVEGSGSASEVGKCAIYRGQAGEVAFQNTLIRIRPHEGVDSRWLMYRINAEAELGGFLQLARGVGIFHLGAKRTSKWPIALPPLDEQHAVVEGLDRLLSRCGSASADVDSVAVRTHLLQAAVLEQLLQEAGKHGERRRLDDLWLHARYGTSEKCTADALGTPVLRIPNVRRRRVNFADIKYASPDADVSGALVHPGDVLVVRTNGSPDLIGRVALVPELALPYACASYLIRLSWDTAAVRPEFMTAVLEAPTVRSQLTSMAASSAGQYNLSVAKLRQVEIPVPPLEVQDELLARVAASETLAGHCRDVVEVALRRTGQLRRALLAAAFAGRLPTATLTPQSERLPAEENVA